MIQSFHTQLRVTLRALREVVAPSVDSKDKQAVEQLQLSIATLDFMRQRLPYARRYYRMELGELLKLGQQAIGIIGAARPAVVESLSKAIATGNGELKRPEAEAEDYQIVSRRLRELLSAAVADAGGEPFEQHLDALITNSFEHLLTRERVWCLPLGLELKPEDFPSIDQLLES